MPGGTHDPLLDGILAGCGEELETAVRDLMTGVALPIVRDILQASRERGMLDEVEAQDLEGDLALRLVRKLHDIAAGEGEPMQSVAGYVAASTYNAIAEVRRRRDPLRRAVEWRVRYVLTHTEGLALWGGDPWLCGSARWAAQPSAASAAPPQLPPRRITDARELRDVLRGALASLAGPVRFDDLVDAVGRSLELPAEPFVPSDVLRDAHEERDPIARLEAREYLTELWSEVTTLPVRQRRALLLQLRLDDGESVTRVLPVFGIAGVRAIAAALEMAPEELAALWNDLPLPDQRIAAMLGATRQQVINLRKSARDRLARRMGRPR